MISQEHAAAKQPVSAVLAGPYGHPFHPILVTIPIGAWVASVVFDIGSRLVGHPSFPAPAAEWLIAVGVLGAVAAASIGFLDFFSIPARTPGLPNRCGPPDAQPAHHRDPKRSATGSMPSM